MMTVDLGFIGFVPLSETLRLQLQCRNGSLVATAPDAAPTWKMYTDSDTAVLTGSLGGTDADSLTGYRTGDAVISAGNGFAVGDRVNVRFSYAISSTAYAAIGSFQVV